MKKFASQNDVHAAGAAQRVIITKASSGLGAALARRYAREGDTLGLVPRRKPELEQLAAQLATAVEIYPLDVQDAAGLAAAARDFITRHGHPDVVRVITICPGYIATPMTAKNPYPMRLFASAPRKPRRSA